MNTRILGLILALTLSQICSPQGKWTQIGDMPELRYGHTVNELNGKIYVVGGANVETHSLPRTALVYDTSSRTWTKIPLAGNKIRNAHSSCILGGKLYVVGGNDSSSTIATMDMFDAASGQWVSKPPMPTDRGLAACVTLGGKIYVIGGVRLTGNVLYAYGLWTVEMYDTSSGIWTQVAHLPSARWGHSAVAWKGKIYVLGGVSFNGANPSYPVAAVYDPATDVWTEISNMPTARYCVTACLLDSTIYVIGGWRHSGLGPLYDKVESYIPKTDKWYTETPMPVARAVLASLVLDGKIRVYGGASTTHPNIGTSAIYEFETKTGLPYAHSVRLSRCGRDTIVITAQVENPFAHSVNVVGILSAGSGEVIDSVFLKDDGFHGDSTSADGLWGCQYVPQKDDTIIVAVRTDDLTLGASFTVSNAATYVFTRGPYIGLDTRTVALGDINHALTRFDTTFQVSNVGWSTDSIYVSLDPIMTPESAISVSPTVFELPAGETQTVVFSVMPSWLSSGAVYNAVVIIDSRFGFGQTRFEKTFAFGTTAVSEEPSLPSAFALRQNYPNPFNPTTNIGFGIAEFGFVSLKVYDVLGRVVATLVNEVKQPGTYTVQFVASELASGVYYYRVQAGGFSAMKKMTLIR